LPPAALPEAKPLKSLTNWLRGSPAGYIVLVNAPAVSFSLSPCGLRKGDSYRKVFAELFSKSDPPEA